MNKLSAGKTIAYAYSFTFANLGTIIGLIWLPLVIATVLGFISQYNSGAPDSADQMSFARVSQGIGVLAGLLLSFLLYAIVFVAVTRQALGLRQGPAVVHFALGMPEFRMFGAVLMLFAVSLFGFILFAGVLDALASAGGAVAQGLAELMSLPLALLYFYAIVRLTFLVVPITLIEEHVSLLRSWQLTANNFWRILVIMLAVSLPILVLYVVGAAFVLGPDVSAPVPASIANNATAFWSYQQDIIRRHQPELVFLQLMLAPFALGLNLSASAYAYRALVANAPAARSA